MRHWLYTHQQVFGEPERLASLLIERIVELISSATKGSERISPDGSFAVRMELGSADRRPSKRVRVRAGVARRADGRTTIPLSWRADPAGTAFPAFEGELVLEPLGSGTAELSLAGSYTVPLGPVGAVVDALGLGRLAEHAAQSTVERIAAALQHEALEPAPPAPGPRGLLLQVADVMTPDPVLLREDQPVREGAMLLLHQRISGAPVIADDGGLAGVLSEQDLLEKQASRAWTPPGPRGREVLRRREATTVGAACSRPAVVTTPEATLRAAARLMLERGVSRLVVVDGSRIAGIVTRHDVLRAFVRSDDELAATAAAALAHLGEDEVRATATLGALRLEGTVTRRSRLPLVLRTVESLDGVIGVDGDLDWALDDVQPGPLAVPTH